MKENKENVWGIKSLIHIFQGAAVGTGAILPGVSGGVLCVAFGIYEPMMALLSSPKKAFKKYYKLFIPFLIGWAAGFLLLARVVEMLFNASSAVALMLFFGLVCGTLPGLFKKAELKEEKASWTSFVISLCVSYLVFNLLENGVTANITPDAFMFALCGAVWGLSMIVPGLSSSSILIYIGLYEPMTEGIASLDFAVILPVMIGIFITALSLAKVVNMMFEKNYALVMKIILGIVISSSLKIVPTEFENVFILLISLICFAGGFFGARLMDKK